MIESFSSNVLDILIQGGFVMPPLVILSIILFTCIFQLFFELIRVARIGHPAQALFKDSDKVADLEFDTIVEERQLWKKHFDRRLKFARILATAAPLLGLLGTVAGMLKTFSAMSTDQGSNTLDLVASGISEALITTETGLAIAIVGLVLVWSIKGCRRRLLIRFESREAEQTLSKLGWEPAC